MRPVVAGLALWLLGALVPAGAAMIKEVAFGQFTDAPSEADAEHYYLRTHGPEIVRLSGPWLRRYVAYRSFDAGAGLDPALGLRRGLYGELWFDSVENYQTRPPLEAVSLPPWQMPGTRGEPDKVLQVVSAAPEHLFVAASAQTMQRSVVRWITLIQYPEGIARSTADHWFLERYALEAAKLPGLLRFACSERALADRPGENGDWVRECEYWFAGIDEFRNAMQHLPTFTAPAWGGRFPFVRLASTLIGNVPEADFLK